MKQWKLSAAVFLMAALMLLAACKASVDQPSEQDPSDDSEQLPTEQSEVTLEDFDDTRVYDQPRYFDMDMSEYITLGRYRNLTLTLASADVTVTDEMVQEEIDLMLSQNHPDAKITDRAVEWEDTVIVSYVGTRDGVAFSGGSASDQSIQVTQENGYIPGFVEGIVGCMPGVATPVPMTFPENYHNADLAGAEVVFTFTVSYIVGEPALTDDFVSEYTGGNYKTAEDYRAALKKLMEDTAYETATHTALWEKIAEISAVKQYPAEAVLYTYQNQYALYSYYAQMFGVDYETYLAYMSATPADLFELCKEQVKKDMVYYAVFADGEYTYTEEQYERALELYTDENYESFSNYMEQQGSGEVDRETAKSYFESEYREQLIAQCLEESAYNDLMQTVTVVIE